LTTAPSDEGKEGKNTGKCTTDTDKCTNGT